MRRFRLEAGVVYFLRRDLKRLYAEHAETVLLFMLRTCSHDGARKLLAALDAATAAVSVEFTENLADRADEWCRP